jgi:hypothetical protein
MGRRKVLLSSTVHRFDGVWWRASLTRMDLLWARRNLVKGQDGKCQVERQPGFTRASLQPHFTGATLPESWSQRVVFVVDEIHPWVLIQLNERFDFRDKFEKAQFNGDPELAPHIMFRRLAHGNDAVALGFLQECGPLFLDDMTRKPLVWIDLNDFWRRHERFVAILRLYESMRDFKSLAEAIIDLAQRKCELQAAGPAGLGMIPHTHKDLPYIRHVHLSEPHYYSMVDEDGDPMWTQRGFQDLARQLIRSELILQTFEGIRSGWEEIAEEGGFEFRPTRIVTSLWAAMWEMFGLDTWRGYSWRSCKICSRFFYPLQMNSECCTPRHQALWSKRQYARKRRELGKCPGKAQIGVKNI